MAEAATKESNLTAEELAELEQCVLTRDAKFRLALKRPIQLGVTTYDALEFRAMEGRDLRKMPLGEGQANAGHFLDMAAGMVTEPAAVVDKISPADALRVVAVVGFFVGHS